MRLIYKYRVDIHGDFSLPLPDNAEFLHVGLDPTGQTCMWWMVDNNNQSINYGFRIAFTGESYGNRVDKYLGTFITGSLVCHLFRR